MTIQEVSYISYQIYHIIRSFQSFGRKCAAASFFAPVLEHPTPAGAKRVEKYMKAAGISDCKSFDVFVGSDDASDETYHNETFMKTILSPEFFNDGRWEAYLMDIGKLPRNTGKLPFYLEYIHVPQKTAERIIKYLECEPKDESECLDEDSTIDFEVRFEDGCRMAVQCCGVQYQEGESNTAWTQAVLFAENGIQLAYTDPEDTFFGTWELTYDDVKYIAIVNVDRFPDLKNDEKEKKHE